MKYLIFALCAALVLPAAPALGATAYVSDELTVPLRSGPSGQHRIIYAGLPSGTKMETLSVNEEAGFTQIRTARGTEGWVRSQYLKFEPIAAMKLDTAYQSLDKARQQLNEAQKQIATLQENSTQQSSLNQRGQSRIEALQDELEELQRISADAIETHATMINLQEENTRLRDELDDLAEDHALLQDNRFNQALMIGGGLLLLGLIAGVAIKARPQRSAWS